MLQGTYRSISILGKGKIKHTNPANVSELEEDKAIDQCSESYPGKCTQHVIKRGLGSVSKRAARFKILPRLPELLGKVDGNGMNSCCSLTHCVTGWNRDEVVAQQRRRGLDNRWYGRPRRTVPALQLKIAMPFNACSVCTRALMIAPDAFRFSSLLNAVTFAINNPILLPPPYLIPAFLARSSSILA